MNRAVAMGAKYVSNSYGGSESGNDKLLDSAYYIHSGVQVVASTGDHFYGTEYPAVSPYVTAVGGTTLTAGLERPRVDRDGVGQRIRRDRQRLLHRGADAAAPDRV